MLLLLCGLVACVDWEGVDADEDGWLVSDGDCDDLDPEVGPGSVEIWYDGVDQDCDGNDADQDGDGFLSALVGGGDCWDDPTTLPDDFTILSGQGFSQPSAIDVSPAAEEVWYDGVDGNCDGLGDFDQDGDGYDSAMALQRDGSVGDDCIDSSEELDALGVDNPDGLAAADIHPDADPDSDACYDGINLDCDAREPAADNSTSAWDSDFDCDQDGWMADQDCDDEDAEAVPDLTLEEVWYDCIDQNCDSNDGDQDGDGWIPESYVEDCPDWVDLHGGDQATVEVGDCWDGGTIIPSGYDVLNGFPQPDPLDVYPGAADTWYDGVDADCAQDSDFDADLDTQTTDVYPDRDGATGGDCDDTEATIYTGATEYCDGVDRDCDGLIEDDDDAVDGVQYYYDEDDDGYGSSASRMSCEPTGLYRADNPDDCDDTDGATYPGADEYCDDEDRDCDLLIDEDHALDASTWYSDADSDGYGDASTADVECDQPSGTVTDATDCDDTDSSVKPGGTEICDGQLNDCDAGSLPSDESDDDGDGYVECAWDASGWDGSGAVSGGEDCDDADGLSYPGGTETCDGTADEDCDGDVDEDDAVDVVTWYYDGDGDSFGGTGTTDLDCDQPTGFVADATDCDDGDASIYPGASELCDGQLNDCDGTGLPSDETDDDGDGAVECTFDVGGWDGSNDVLADEDCDDADEDSFPGGNETCDGVADEDCDGTVDEDDAAAGSTWYRDSDSDSYGDSATTKTACSLPTGYVADDTDCDDDAAGVNPGEDEVCDGSTDEDCDLTVDESTAIDASTWFHDADNDEAGDASDSEVACDAPADHVADDTDCDDTDGSLFSGAPELCDGLINDCDSSTLPSDETDDDGDGVVECTFDVGGWEGSGDVLDDEDCDDADEDSFPGGTETCDGLADEDCDGQVDESGCVSDVTTAALVLDGPSSGDRAGFSLDACGDLTGDGLEDLVIGAYKADPGAGSEAGGAYILAGTLTGTVDIGTAISAVYGSDSGGRLSYDLMGGGDADGDGQVDLIVGAYAAQGSGEAYLIHGPITSAVDATSADAIVGTAGGNTRVGISVGFLWPQDGGSADAILVGSDKYDVSKDEGQVMVFSGASGDLTEASALATIEGVQESEGLGFAIDGSGDLNGDGIGDLLLGAEKYDDGGNSDAGAAHIFYGPVSGSLTLSSSDEVTVGESGARLGQALDLGTDVDGDGLDDVVLGGFEDDSVTSNGGVAYLFTGSLSGSASTSATATIAPTEDDQDVGWSVRLGGDVNGDGNGDLLVGAPRVDTDAGNNTGAGYVFYGPLSGTLTLDDADYAWEGQISESRAGTSMSFVPDVDGDGRDEVLIGAEKDDTVDNDRGAAYLMLGGDL